MTAIVGVLNSQGIAIAADSAVTVTGSNGKKVYNRSNKIFTLSKYHPVGIAIYSSADFLGIPLETLIKLYREKIKDSSFRTLNEYKLDFIEFIKSKVGHISREYKRDAFYVFCGESVNAIKDNIIKNLDTRVTELSLLSQAEAINLIDTQILSEIEAHLANVQGFNKASYINISFADYSNYYQNELIEITNYIQAEIQKKYNGATLKPNHVSKLTEVLYELVNVEFIFEKYCGLVFIGFGEDEIYPSSQLALLGTLIADSPRVRIFDIIEIIPGKSNSNILPYAQGDVTTAVLTGVDPNYKNEAKESIKSAFDTISGELGNYIADPLQVQQITGVIHTNAIMINLIGAGGTGSQVLTALARMHQSLLALNHAGLFVRVFDDDVITTANIGRQLFANAEIGLPKAVLLINRINRFFGTDWKAITMQYNKTNADSIKDYKAHITLSCVDTVRARFEIAAILKQLSKSNAYSRDKVCYWVDFGNSRDTGQVLLATIGKIEQPASKKFTTVDNLPLPTEEFKDLFKAAKEDTTPSCSLAEALAKQDLFINSSLANMGASLLWQLFREGMITNRGFFLNLRDFKLQPLKVA